MNESTEVFGQEQNRSGWYHFAVFFAVVGIAYYLYGQPVTMGHIMVIGYGMLWYQEDSLRKKVAALEKQIAAIAARG